MGLNFGSAEPIDGTKNGLSRSEQRTATNQKHPLTRKAPYKFESIPLQRRVCKLSVPVCIKRSGETHQVLDLIRRVSEHGLSVVLISHSMPEVFAIADRIHIHRLGRRAAIVSPKTTVMSDVVAVMTGALPSDAVVSAALAPAGAPDF